MHRRSVLTRVRAGGCLAALLLAGLWPWLAAEAASKSSPQADPKDHWAYRPLAEVKLPAVRDAAWVKSPVDAFVLARLEAAGLEPVGAADKLTLLRRATFDLIGLPPTPEEIAAFLADDSPNAFAAVVERLLASPHYGERWGRHWMDLVRYADTAGDNSDYPIPQAHLYRDYIIDSFNRDKPYDRFITEQLAGDLMPHDSESQRREQIIATGYIASARRFGSVVDKYPQHLTIEDTLENIGRTFLGLSMSCARCHDHKFDAISRFDYYGLYGIFASTRYPFPGIELKKIQTDFVPLVPAEEVEAAMKPWREKIAPVEQKIKQTIAAKLDAEKRKDEAAVVKLRSELRRLETQRAELDREKPRFEDAYAVSELKPVNAKVHIRGEPDQLGDETPRRFLSVLGGQCLAPEEAQSTSGRLQLAQWITDPANPLTARVMVNRIWQHHFGRGLAATPNDFGVRGLAPSHPELLDDLARRFIDSGWSVKAMHRLMMLSSTYQLAAAGKTQQALRDPENVLLWKYNRRRLDAESLRDAMMSVSGALNLARPSGPHPFPPREKWGFTQHYPFRDDYPSTHRSVYRMQPRLRVMPFYATFDGADPNAPTAVRTTSTTAAQALYMLNDAMLHEQAERAAERLMREAATDEQRIERLHLLALGRPADEQEKQAAAELMKRTAARLTDKDEPQRRREALAAYARVVFRLSEFLYVD